MNDDDLKRRLRAAKGIDTTAPPSAGFSVQVRNVASSRQQRRVVLASGATLCAVLLSFWGVSQHDEAVTPPISVKPAVVEELSLDEVRRAADEAQALVDAIRTKRKQHDALAAARTTLRQPIRTFEAELALNEAVAMRFTRAERLVAHGDWPAATVSYERVIELLPDSSFAADARASLSRSPELQ